MISENLTILLADDDEDDCFFFKEVLKELTVNATLTIATNGEQLMRLLSEKEETLPDAIFLDLNMPRKSGLDCLSEIKSNEKLKQLPIIIFSTSFDPEVANLLHEHGANYYIRKPAEFSSLKKITSKSLDLIVETRGQQTLKEKFLLTGV